MTTGYEVGMYNDIHQIAQALNRIANVKEAEEKRAREHETLTPDELAVLAPAILAVRRGFKDLEEAQRQQREGTDDRG